MRNKHPFPRRSPRIHFHLAVVLRGALYTAKVVSTDSPHPLSGSVEPREVGWIGGGGVIWDEAIAHSEGRDRDNGLFRSRGGEWPTNGALSNTRNVGRRKARNTLPPLYVDP
eukprot:4592385-Prymnesium_polylepis.2